MPNFSYNIKNKEGKVAKGVIEAESKEKLIEYFQNQGCIIFSIDEAKAKTGVSRPQKIKSEDLVVFSRQFTTLIESGIPVVEALEILREQVEKKSFKEVLSMVLKDVREGGSLSSCFARHSKVFPEIYISMVEAGEASGKLPGILERVSVYLEKSATLRKKIISSLFYPVTIVILAISITTFLMIKVVPTFKSIFASLGGTLPLPTQILIKISDFLSRKEVMISVVVFGFAGGFLFSKYISTDQGKRNYHRFLLRLPVFGDLIKKIAIARFAMTFSTLIKSGVPIMRCLDIVGKTSGNKIIEDAIIKAKKFIQEGQPISLPLEESTVFPPMVVKMIAIGEKTGNLESMLSKISEFYEAQTDAMIAGLASLIEPMVIVFLGVIVGGIVISLFLPITQISQYISK